ncbi:MAG: chloride channel protein [Staphylococcus sp.]|nr:chloride channel protein [Staphylococcus sp.]
MSGQSKANIKDRKPDRMERLRQWRKENLSDAPFVFILSSIVGILSGLGAFVLKRLIAWVSIFLTSHFHAFSGNWELLLIPVAGIVLTGILCRYVFRAHIAHGVDRLMKNLPKHIYNIKPLMTYAPMLASTITLGFGGSAGSEGPIAYTGAAIGSNMGRFFRLSPRMMRVMVGCGAAAGIAGIFKSPLGGALFTLEVLRVPMTTFSVLVLLVTVIAASMTAFMLSGFSLDIPFDPGVAFDPSLLPYVALLGIFCGFYSLYYSYIMKKIGLVLGHLSNPWLKNLCGGALLAILVFLFPSLYGEGYGVVGHVINGDFSGIVRDSIFSGAMSDTTFMILVAGGTMLAKCFATSATNNGGGVSGDFAPTLFAGCLTGFFFASLLNSLFGLGLPVGHFAFYAMAGVMAGAIRAPLMAIFLTCEMGAAYSFFLPLMLTGALSFGVVRLFTADGYFSSHIDRHNGLIEQVKKDSDG